MKHTLDERPLTESAIYINELQLANDIYYVTLEDYDKALTGETKKQGRVLPDDNCRVYIPMDLNASSIMYSLDMLYHYFGYPTDDNELAFSIKVEKIIDKLEIYDQFWVESGRSKIVQKEPDGIKHSAKGIALAKKIVKRLLKTEGCAECFPYDVIDQLTETFWLSE